MGNTTSLMASAPPHSIHAPVGNGALLAPIAPQPGLASTFQGAGPQRALIEAKAKPLPRTQPSASARGNKPHNVSKRRVPPAMNPAIDATAAPPSRDDVRAEWIGGNVSINRNYSASRVLRILGSSRRPFASLAEVADDLHFAAHGKGLPSRQKKMADIAGQWVDVATSLHPRIMLSRNLAGGMASLADMLDGKPFTAEQTNAALLALDLRAIGRPSYQRVEASADLAPLREPASVPEPPDMRQGALPTETRPIIDEHWLREHVATPTESLPAPNAEGLIHHGGKTWIKGDGGYYQVHRSARNGWSVYTRGGLHDVPVQFEPATAQWRAYPKLSLNGGGGATSKQMRAAPPESGGTASGRRASNEPASDGAASGRTASNRLAPPPSELMPKDSMDGFRIVTSSFPLLAARPQLAGRIRRAFRNLGKLSLLRSNRPDRRHMTDYSIFEARNSIVEELESSGRTSSLESRQESAARITTNYYEAHRGSEAYCQENSEILFQYLLDEGVSRKRLSMITFTDSDSGHVAVLYTKHMSAFKGMISEDKQAFLSEADFANTVFEQRATTLLLNPWGRAKLLGFEHAETPQDVVNTIDMATGEAGILSRFGYRVRATLPK